MPTGRVFILCLLLLLLPLRSVLAAAQLECAPAAGPAHAAMAHEGHEHHAHEEAGHADNGDIDGHQACKLCAPCCLAAAPPPTLLPAATVALAARAPRQPVLSWSGVVPPLPDPPPRG